MPDRLMLDYARKPICGHEDRPIHARGMCQHCYDAWRWENSTSSHKFGGDPERNHPELWLGIVVDKHCKLCGDAIPRKKRNCQLHPDICNTCEQEYCECQVPFLNSDLIPGKIDEVVKMPEEDQVPVLLARKWTIKMAGGKATAMNIIVNKPAEDLPYAPTSLWRLDEPNDE